MNTLFENKTTPVIIDIRDLIKAAEKAIEVLKDEHSDEDEKREASDNLAILGEALTGFEYEQAYAPYSLPDDADEEDVENYFYGEDIPELLESIGDNFDVTLLHEDYVADYLEDKAVELGWLTEETPSIICLSIDWQRVADEYITDCASFTLEGNLYWINK